MCKNTVANFDMYVGLPKDKKGTHMSRFVEILNQFDSPFSSDSFKKMLDKNGSSVRGKIWGNQDGISIFY